MGGGGGGAPPSFPFSFPAYFPLIFQFLGICSPAYFFLPQKNLRDIFFSWHFAFPRPEKILWDCFLWLGFCYPPPFFERKMYFVSFQNSIFQFSSSCFDKKIFDQLENNSRHCLLYLLFSERWMIVFYDKDNCFFCSFLNNCQFFLVQDLSLCQNGFFVGVNHSIFYLQKLLDFCLIFFSLVIGLVHVLSHPAVRFIISVRSSSEW